MRSQKESEENFNLFLTEGEGARIQRAGYISLYYEAEQSI